MSKEIIICKLLILQKLVTDLMILLLLKFGGSYTYNPLNKPNLKPIVLANRLKEILMLFSPNNSESYWLDKAEQILEACIKLDMSLLKKYII